MTFEKISIQRVHIYNDHKLQNQNETNKTNFLRANITSWLEIL